MNETIYQLAAQGGTIRIAIQKKPDGDFILGISNGKNHPLICQGAKEIVDAEFEAKLPDYLEKLKAARIEAQLNAIDEQEIPSTTLDEKCNKENSNTSIPNIKTTASTTPTSNTNTQKEEQPELDFGF